ncbi:uncharacterized protein [Erythrolamprus reginae]|uniref:uncharacterized protein n=1 Tax=Erythrolamprus reginae TaxID=121349 RepID=UPI00396C4FBD
MVLGFQGTATDRDWSPDRQASQCPPPLPSPNVRSDRPSSSHSQAMPQIGMQTAYGPSATFTPTAAGLREQSDAWQAFSPAIQDMVANAYSQGIAAATQRAHTFPLQATQPRDPWSAPPPPTGLDSMADDHSNFEQDSDHGMDLSDDEFTLPEQPAMAGLFKPSLFRVLLHKAKQALDVPGAVAPVESGDGRRTSATLCKEAVKESDKVPALEIFLQNVKRPWQHPAAAQGPSNLERRFYTFDDAMENLLLFPPVDKPVATLVSTAVVPSDNADSLKPDERRAETLLKKTHQMAAWALRAASTASFFSRASIMWIQEVQARLGPEDTRLRQDLNKLLATAEFSTDATLHAAKFASRAMASTISSRRLLWLRNWQVDAKSKWPLSSAPFEGSKLFGESLEPVLVEDKDKRKVLPRSYRRQDRRTGPYSRRQSFRWDQTPPTTQPARPYTQGRPFGRQATAFQRNLAGSYHRFLGAGNRISGTTPRISAKSSSPICGLSGTQGPHKKDSLGTRDFASLGYSGNRAGAVQPGGYGVLFTGVPRTQIIRGLQAHLEPQTSEPIRCLPKVQDGLPPFHPGRHSAWGLPYFGRSEGGLSTRPYTSVASSISSILPAQRALPIQGNAIRPFIGPAHLHEALGCADGKATIPVHPDPCIFGRYSPSVRRPENSASGVADHVDLTTTPWLHGQCAEESFGAGDQAHPSGCSGGHSFQQGVSLHRETTQRVRTGEQASTAPESPIVPTVQSAGDTGVVRGHCSLGPLPLPHASVDPTPLPAAAPKPYTPADLRGAGATILSEMVEVLGAASGLPLRTPVIYHSYHRCQPPEMGRPCQLPGDTRVLDTPGPTTCQYQFPGLTGCPFGTPGLFTPAGGTSCSRPHGQCGHQGTFKSPGRDAVTQTHDRNCPAFRLGGNSPCLSTCGAHSGRGQPAGGLAQPSGTGSGGVETRSPSFSRNCPSLWGTSGGSVCHIPKHPAPKVLLPVCITGSRGSQCTSPPVAKDTTLCLSPPSASPKGDREGSRGEGRHNVVGTALAATALVRGPHGALCLPTVEDSGRPDFPQPRVCAPSGPTMAPSNRLALEGNSLRNCQLPDNVITTIQAARRPSTTRIYQATWAAFTSFCSTRHLQPQDSSVLSVLEFLQTGLDKGLAPNTLRRHVAALATIIRREDGGPLAHHPWIKDFLRGAANTHPPPIRRFPTWDLTLVLQALTGPPFEPLRTVSLRFLSLKTIFLVAVTSARRVSELSALSVRPDLCTFYPDRVVLRLDPTFVPKVNTHFHRAQELILPDFCTKGNHPLALKWHKVDVRRALKLYIRRTKAIRKTEALFVSFSSLRLGLKVSPNTVSQWVRLCIVEAYRASSTSPPTGI